MTTVHTPARLLLGPLLRFVSTDEATLWVEVDRPCLVCILDKTEPTFCVAGHHYAIVCLSGLEPGASARYEVSLDGLHTGLGDRRLPIGSREGLARTARSLAEAYSGSRPQ